MANSSNSKKDTILIIVTIVLVIALAAGLFYDRNTAVFDRTLKIERTEDMKILHMYKSGIMFYRNSYQAQVQIPTSRLGDFVTLVMNSYDFEPELYNYEDFVEQFSDVFASATIRPNPDPQSQIVILRGTDSDGNTVTFVVSIEGESIAFVYIYFTR